MKLACSLLALITIPVIAFAQQPSANEVRQKVLAAASAYATAIACDVKVEASNVVPLVPYTDMGNRDDALYVVLWQGDIGCAGGSGTGGIQVSTVRIGAGDSYMVDVGASSPLVELPLPGRFSKVLRHSGNRVSIEILEHRPSDPECCPSRKKQVNLLRSEDGQWRESR